MITTQNALETIKNNGYFEVKNGGVEMLADKNDVVIGKGFGTNPYEDKQFQFDPRQDGVRTADACMERVRNTAGKYYPLSIKVIKNGWMVSDQLGQETAFLKKEDLIKFITEWCGE